MSALPQCDAFGYIYDQAGDPAPDVLVTLKRVLDASGNSILLSPITTLTDSAGSFHFTLPEDAQATIAARASGLWDCPDGRFFKVPPGPSGELIPGFWLSPSTLVLAPLIYVDGVLSLPKASATQDGYLSAADYVRFEAGAADMGITEIDTGAGLTGGPITETGTIGLQIIGGVAGTWSNPSTVTVNAYGQIISITSGSPDTTPPEITSIGTTALAATSVTIIWTTNEPADSQVDYGPTIGYGTSTPLNTTPVTSHSVPITGLTPGIPYHYRVKSRDAALNPQTSGDNTFTTPTAPDTSPPVITAVTAGSITATTATITWTTDEASDSQVEYGTTTSYGSSTPLDTTLVTSHSVSLTGLAESTDYHYHVKSRDASLNQKVSDDFTFTTPAAPLDVTIGLVSYWKMDETSGPRADTVGSSPFTLFSGTDQFATGKVGNALKCGGASAPALWVAADHPSQHFTGSFTIAGWIYPETSTPTINPIVSKWGGAGSHSYFLLYNEQTPDTEFAVSRDGTDVVTVVAPGVLAINTWHFIVGWFDASDESIHLQINDGTPTNLSLGWTAGTPVFGSAAGLATLVYADGVGLNYAIARSDEVGMWSRVLTAAERHHLYNDFLGITYPF